MKKILALVLVLMMTLVSAAFAEAEYSYTEIYFDEANIAEIPGEWVEVADFGVKFYLPSVLTALEITEEDMAGGAIAAFATEDMSASMSLGYAAAVDAEGNALEYIEDLAAQYAEAGVSEVDVAFVNEWPIVTYAIPDQGLMGAAVLFGDGTQLTMNFAPIADENYAALATIMISSFMEM